MDLQPLKDACDDRAKQTGYTWISPGQVLSLVAEIERLRAALKPFAHVAQCYADAHAKRRAGGSDLDPWPDSHRVYIGLGECRAADAALRHEQRAAQNREGFPGAFVVDDDEFDRIIHDLQNPKPPSNSIKRGAELLRKLYGQKEDGK